LAQDVFQFSSIRIADEVSIYALKACFIMNKCLILGTNQVFRILTCKKVEVDLNNYTGYLEIKFSLLSGVFNNTTTDLTTPTIHPMTSTISTNASIPYQYKQVET
jgi:hypothetical protein